MAYGIEGKWRLDKKKDLYFDVDQNQTKSFGRTLRFNAGLVKAGGDRLSFAAIERLTPSLKSVKRFDLKGNFKVSYGNISFLVRRQKNNDELMFGRDWLTDEENNIVFPDDKVKNGKSGILLKGAWEGKKNRLKFKSSGGKDLIFDELSASRVIVNKNSRSILELVVCGQDINSRAKPKYISLAGDLKKRGSGLTFTVYSGTTAKKWRVSLIKALGAGCETEIEAVKTKSKKTDFGLCLRKKFSPGKEIFLKGSNTEGSKNFQAGLKLKF